MSKLKTPLINTLFGILFGMLMLFVNVDFMLNVISIAIGIYLIISGVLQLAHDEQDKIIAATSIITIGLGTLCVIFRNEIISILVGIVLIVVPVIRICIADDWKKQFKKEIVSIIVGVVLIVIGPTNTIEIIVRILGLICILLAIIYFIHQLISFKKNKKNNVLDAEYEIKE